jgi:hypothetical protein
MITHKAPIRFWGRKPGEIVWRLISDEDYVVVDPFGGSGVISRITLEKGKKAIYVDINPYAWLISHVSIAGADQDEFVDAANNVLENARRKLIFREKLRNDKLYYFNGRPFLKKRNYERVSDFFPRENLHMLFSILRAIDQQKTTHRTKLALYLAFCNTLFSSSYMKRPGAGSWGVPSYWVPRVNAPENPFEAFERSVKRLAMFLRTTSFYKVCYNPRKLHICDAILLLSNAVSMRYNSVWSVITDPPHFDEIQYMELSFFYWAWLRESKFPELLKILLGKKPRFYISKELTVNPNRGSTLSTYLESINKFLVKTRRTRRKVLMFHEEDEKIISEIINLARRAWGDIVVETITISKQRRIGPRGGTTYTLLKSPY